METLESMQVPVEACISSSVSTAPVTTLPPRHSVLVRITHWIITLCFFALLLTGVEAAWIAVLTGLLYAISGLFTGHFRKDFKSEPHALESLPYMRPFQGGLLVIEIVDHQRTNALHLDDGASSMSSEMRLSARN
ncbi:MAG: hypothetical protein DMF15_12735 [Verrucomicrobia bacterium]|nr:MAG: hypothetical protein DMF15_12735 [Verrucomicrobiota bacterium]